MRQIARRYHRPQSEIIFGRFNIRLGEALHERLVVESMKENEGLNAYCVKVLKEDVGL